MPELPEVETARGRIQRALLGRVITAVTTAADPIVLEGPRGRFAKALVGARVVGTGRRGKYFWLELDRRPWLLIHFGMTGGLAVYEEMEQRPRFWKLEIVAGDLRVGLYDARRLGRIRLVGDPLSEPPVSLLGFDPVIDLPSTAELVRRLRVRSGPIKAVLLDQGFSAGVGNWVADEVLYQAGIAPRRPARELDGAEVGRLRKALRAVCTHAVAVEADSDRFPRTWLFHHRWGKAEGARTGRGESIEFDEVGGRTTAWVPRRQK